MTKHFIDAILFDMGGTLRGSKRTEPQVRAEAVEEIVRLASLGAGDWDRILTERGRAYLNWSRETMLELDEARLWTEWMLPERPREEVRRLALELNRTWRKANGVRLPFPETREVVLELFRRGYRLGLVSNTTTSVEIPKLLHELELTGCFETVVLSCELGRRKPDPFILLEAAHRMNVQPRNCVYVGDRFDRDLPAARGAGFAGVVITRQGKADRVPVDEEPDHLIDNLRELLDIFPPRAEAAVGTRYHASLSTMWAKANFPYLGDFFEGARRLGYDQVELNHQINSAKLAGLDLERLPLSSLHEPCPAEVPVEKLKERDELISSPDEERRRLGVEAVLRSVEMAARLRLPVIVVHCGMVALDVTEEKALRRLKEAGEQDGPEFREIREGMLAKRRALIGPRLESVRRSLLELLEAAEGTGVRLGLENRYHYYDIPSPDEMEGLLSLAGPERLGFILDVGHAQAMDWLGFYPREEWLRRFAPRIIEVHLHDVIGMNDHLAPGRGEVDFASLAPYLPAEALRILELHPSNTPGQVRAALEHLADHGCIRIAEKDRTAQEGKPQ